MLTWVDLVNPIYCYFNIKKIYSWKRNWIKLYFYGLFGFFWTIKVNQITSSQSLYGFKKIPLKKLTISRYFFYIQEKFDPAHNIAEAKSSSICVLYYRKIKNKKQFLKLINARGKFRSSLWSRLWDIFHQYYLMLLRLFL
jgi:hypothetical protein